MQNTGYLKYNTLIKVDAETGVPTGEEKPNVIGDPDYVPPTYDPVSCPISDPTEEVVNKLSVVFKNESTQFINFTTVKVLPQNISGTYYNSSLSQTPSQIKTEIFKNQVDDYIKLEIYPTTFSKGYPLHVVIKYRGNTVRVFDVLIGDSIVEKYIDVKRQSVTSNNTLEIIFSDILPTTNIPPVANAGIDQTITIPTNSVNLNGAASVDPDRFIVSYEWIKKSGGSYTIVNGNTATPQLNNLIAGTYVFTLRVTDDKGATHEDDVQITVNPEIPITINAPVKFFVSNLNGAGSSITSAKFRNISTGVDTELLSVPITSADGFVSKIVEAGTYDIKLSVQLPASSLNVAGRVINTPLSTDYYFNNVEVFVSLFGGGGIVVSLLNDSSVSIAPVFAKLVYEPDIIETEHVALPNSLIKRKMQGVTIKTFSDSLGTTPALNSLSYRYKIKRMNVLTGIEDVTIENILFSDQHTYFIEDMLEYKLFDMDVSDVVPKEHYTYTYELMGADGYLLI